MQEGDVTVTVTIIPRQLIGEPQPGICRLTLNTDHASSNFIFLLPQVSTIGCPFTLVADTCPMRGSPQWDTFRCLGPDPQTSAVSLCFLVPEHYRTPWEG